MAHKTYTCTVPEDYFAQDIPRRIRSHNLQSLCLVASAFAKLRKSDETLFEAPSAGPGLGFEWLRMLWMQVTLGSSSFWMLYLSLSSP